MAERSDRDLTMFFLLILSGIELTLTKIFNKISETFPRHTPSPGRVDGDSQHPTHWKKDRVESVQHRK